MRKSWGGGKGIPCGGMLGGIGPPGPPPWGGGNGGKGMPRPGIGAVFFLDERISRGRSVMQRKERGFYEGEIRGGHLVVGRLASQREVGEDLSI